MGDYSWEFEQRKEPTGSDDKDESANPRWVILLELRKRDEVFEPSRQWPCLIDADGVLALGYSINRPRPSTVLISIGGSGLGSDGLISAEPRCDGHAKIDLDKMKWVHWRL